MIKKSYPLLIIAIVSIMILSCYQTSATIFIKNRQESIKATEVYEDINLKKGDIVWRNVDRENYPLFQFFSHSMMYIGRNGDLYEFIESHGTDGVVKFTKTKEEIMQDTEIHGYVSRVIGLDETYIDNAVAFMESQVGKEFLEIIIQSKNYNPDDPNDPNSDKWYCTEIIWAAYYNCYNHPDTKIYGEGVDIDSDRGKNVFPSDIFYSLHTEKIVFLESESSESKNNYNQNFRFKDFSSFIIQKIFRDLRRICNLNI